MQTTHEIVEARRILRDAALHCYHSGNLLYEGYELTDQQHGDADAFDLLWQLYRYGCVIAIPVP